VGGRRLQKKDGGQGKEEQGAVEGPQDTVLLHRLQKILLLPAAWFYQDQLCGQVA